MLSFMANASTWASYRPGEKFFYLNEGYVVLGKIIEKATSMRYEDYVKKNILEPLGMRRTYFDKSSVEKDPNAAKPYLVTTEGRIEESKFPYGILADGGMLSTVLDLLKLANALIGRGKLGDTEILARSLVEEMEKPRIRMPYTLFGDESYGYGVIIYPRFLGAYKLVGHSGSVLVYTGFYGYIAEEDLAVAVLANASGYPLSAIGMYALSIALGHEPEKELPFIAREKVLKKLEGVYKGYKGTIYFKLSRLGSDFLILEYKDRATEMKKPLIPLELQKDHAIFWTLDFSRRLEVEFEIKQGKIIMYYERYRLEKTIEH